MSEPAYEWGHEHFCETDVVPTITSTGRWSFWPMPISIGEDGLDALAGAVKLDRTDQDAARELEFPIRLDHLPDPPTFCSGCLRWFNEPEGLGPPPQEKDDTNE